VEGEASPIIEVFVHDVFPPAAPAGLQAVASGVGQPPFVDLTWAPNTEADLAGYNVYRRQAGQPPVKISTELVKAPAYRDREVTAGHNYFYAVTAVDLRGNESPRSDETSESLP
jgi:fibronectin type 3 domain-containing protein